MILLGTGERHDLDRATVGGKAFSIKTMLDMGLPVPPAFVFPTDVCVQYYRSGRRVPATVYDGLRRGITALEHMVGRKFGDPEAPLLVSVRSGAARSMPGMMDTILNLGVDAEIAAALSEKSGNDAFGPDTHRRFTEQFTKIVGRPPGTDPWKQLEAAVIAVFDSWNSPRAVTYRRHHDLPDDAGTAVTVQAMVFGNLGADSGTGVLFSRNPVTGDREPDGEWLPGGQGEDVVSGQFDPLPLSHLAATMPQAHDQLIASARRLEREFADVQDIEFTVERGKLWLLQARAAKRSATAAVRHAVAMHEEGLLSVEEALAKVTPEQLSAVLRPHLEPEMRAAAMVLAKGEPACPGVATGVVVTTADEAEREAEAGRDVVLATPTTCPDDVHGMLAAQAIVTEVGGATCHAAVVSRELGRPCVVGCGSGTLAKLAGRVVTVDSVNGEVLDGALPVSGPGHYGDPAVVTFTDWVLHHSSKTSEPLRTVLATASSSRP